MENFFPMITQTSWGPHSLLFLNIPLKHVQHQWLNSDFGNAYMWSLCCVNNLCTWAAKCIFLQKKMCIGKDKRQQTNTSLTLFLIISVIVRNLPKCQPTAPSTINCCRLFICWFFVELGKVLCRYQNSSHRGTFLDNQVIRHTGLISDAKSLSLEKLRPFFSAPSQIIFME